MWDLLKRFFSTNRALQVSDISQRYYEILRDMNEFEYPYVVGNYMDSDGSYLIFTDYGRLYRVRYTTDGVDVYFSDYTEVVIEFSDVSRSTQVFRDKDGKLKFFAIASSATINRVGEIDTTSLFDSFEESFSEPVPLNFYHVQKKPMRMGDILGVKRDGELLIIWGEIDEETFLGKYAEKRFKKGDYGISIEFLSQLQERIKVSGVDIKTHTRGVFIGAAALLESDAASYFTNLIVDRGIDMDDKLKKLLVDFTGDENAVTEFAKEVDLRQREIKESGMVTRANGEKEVETQGQEKVLDDLGNVEVEETQDEEIVIDDSLIDSIAERMKSIIDSAINKSASETETKFQEKLDKITEMFRNVEREVKEVKTFKREIEEVQEEETPLARRKRYVSRRPSETNSEVIENDIDEEDTVAMRNKRFAAMRQEAQKEEVVEKI